jgi:hypothetical protein
LGFCLFVLLEENLEILLIEIDVKIVFLYCFHDEIDIKMVVWNFVWLWRGEGDPLLIFDFYFWIVD